MSQFSFINDLNAAVKMDEPLTKGPVPRWQKKCLESSFSNINLTLNSSKSKSSTINSTVSSKTPKSYGSKKSCEAMGLMKTPLKTPTRTPKKSPSPRPPSASPTPRKENKTPSAADRFIPVRCASQFDLGHYKFMDQPCEENLSPSQKEKQRAMSENLHGHDIENARILAFQKKAPAPPEGYTNPLKVVYSQTKAPLSAKSASRYIPQAPDRILDAPDIIDDYYLNLIDWSPSNILAVALGASVYLWNAGTGNIDHLIDLEGGDYVCSLSWIQEGNILAVGNSLGSIQLWDASQVKRVRIMDGHTGRVGALSWNSYILSSGSRSGQIIHHDVRQRNHRISVLSGHTQEVCGLKWSPDGRYLASGGNDNTLNIWSAVPGQIYSQSQPLYTFSAHQAAVKALAWCPWQPSLLASGGGTADRHIRFWNCNSGACLSSVDTKSQVCALLWSTNYKELISGHGFANNQLIVWKYPSLVKATELTGHTARVLHLAMSPDGSTVLSAAADETLRLWKCFAPDPTKKKEASETKNVTSFLKKSIR
ncbi:cell division cycle 20 protein fzy [Lycorma delicatula]|uniref:cell division cycle 20 protein fzy n=1 Tax=Lycorma delicatula TaxID=130591 RepID=UPI003F51005F